MQIHYCIVVTGASHEGHNYILRVLWVQHSSQTTWPWRWHHCTSL